MVAINVTVEEQGSPRQVLAQFPSASEAMLAETVLRCHDKYLPRHFTVAAETIYNLRQRAEKYRQKKLKTRGEVRPLVLSGETMRQATAGIQVDKQSGAAKGKITVPWYIKQF